MVERTFGRNALETNLVRQGTRPGRFRTPKHVQADGRVAQPMVGVPTTRKPGSREVETFINLIRRKANKSQNSTNACLAHSSGNRPAFRFFPLSSRSDMLPAILRANSTVCCLGLYPDQLWVAERIRIPIEARDNGRDKSKMNFHNVAGPMTPVQARGERKPYVRPALRRLTPEAAKELLLQKGDLSDPEVRHMLQRIEELLNGSGPSCAR